VFLVQLRQCLGGLGGLYEVALRANKPENHKKSGDRAKHNRCDVTLYVEQGNAEIQFLQNGRTDQGQAANKRTGEEQSFSQEIQITHLSLALPRSPLNRNTATVGLQLWERPGRQRSNIYYLYAIISFIRLF